MKEGEGEKGKRKEGRKEGRNETEEGKTKEREKRTVCVCINKIPRLMFWRDARRRRLVVCGSLQLQCCSAADTFNYFTKSSFKWKYAKLSQLASAVCICTRVVPTTHTHTHNNVASTELKRKTRIRKKKNTEENENTHENATAHERTHCFTTNN